MAKRKLLTLGNPKTRKGERAGVMTAVLHLAPASSAGFGTVCPFATPGCMLSCLNTAGRGGIFKAGAVTNAIQEARKSRTAFYKESRYAFHDALAEEIAAAKRKAERMGMTLAVRCNGTSDLPGIAIAMATRFPDVQFYDYTKIPMWRTVLQVPANLHYTFSRSENNAGDVVDAMLHGMNVAVVFDTPRGKPLPARYLERVVIDGDLTDLRYTDPKGVIVGLRAKGRARKDTSGFVVQAI